MSAQAPDPLSPRAPPTTSQRQQTTAFNPAQSPTSPRMPSVSQSVATSESLVQCVLQQICQNDKDSPWYCWLMAGGILGEICLGIPRAYLQACLVYCSAGNIDLQLTEGF